MDSLQQKQILKPHDLKQYDWIDKDYNTRQFFIVKEDQLQ